MIAFRALQLAPDTVNPTLTPTALGAAISVTVKAVLLALVALGAVPLDESQVAALVLAVTAVADLGVYLGIVRPRVTPVDNPRDRDGTLLVRSE
ncbi:hypothetical protein [Longispora fulva]|uniref:Uncharacterized protein n=1 Tax=Longispora fulva TaxID=619741 RepID=A0A8J7KWF6_9ACTN|nr:hypothetical protein [Longispora fulva]MBG6136502.1 hypothetical protein [Longispora fulva]